MGDTYPKHRASMDLGRLRQRLASPLTEVKSRESGKVDVVNIEVSGKMVKMLCAPYKDPQHPLTFLEALDIDVIILNKNLADGDDLVSPVVMAKLIDNPETLLVIYSEVEPVSDTLQTVLETPRIEQNTYWYEKVQVYYWPPGAGKTGKGGIQVKALVLRAGVKIKKKVCTTLLDREASQCLCHLATRHYKSRHTSVWVTVNMMNQGSCPSCFLRGWQRSWGPKIARRKSSSLIAMCTWRRRWQRYIVPPQVCSLQLTKQKRSDWAQSYHYEVTQRVQAGIDQTRLAQCELWIQFGMPMCVEDKNVGYARIEVSVAEGPSQHAHEEVADEDLEDLSDNDNDPLLTRSDRRSPRKSTQARAF